MNIDFTPFAGLDKETATIHLAKIVEAIQTDMKSRGEKFSARAFNIALNEAPGIEMDNTMAVQRARAREKKLSNGIPLGPTEAIFGSEDLARVIYYTLVHRGREDWPTVREYVKKKLGEPFAKIASLPPISDDALFKAAVAAEMERTPESASITKGMFDLALKVRPLETKLRDLANVVDRQNLTIVNSSNRNTELTARNQELISVLYEIKELLHALQVQIDDQPDIQRKIEMQGQLENYSKKLDNILR